MPSLQDIKRRIRSVRNTQKITRAMKMVAAAKLRRAQDSLANVRPYVTHIRGLTERLAARAEEPHPFLEERSRELPAALVVITADRGLCGGFNAILVNETLRLLREQFASRTVKLSVVGWRGSETLRRRGAELEAAYSQVDDDSPQRLGRTIANRFMEAYRAEEVGEVYCLFNEFRSAINQPLRLERLLPMQAEGDRQDPTVDFMYEPSAEEVLDHLLVNYLRVEMSRMLREAAASEHGSRMTAMDSATNNAGEVIDRLTLQYNRVRQDAITREVIEVVSGAEAL
ncbi:MAG: ATP synthase F1 subunit gamma [Candidatus Hydrogenedentota bacterium]